MERLTDKYSDGTPFIPNYVLQRTNGMPDVIKKLSEYEDMEEDERLLKMPCKEGDTVYVVGTKCLADVVSDEECDDMIDCEICPYDKECIVFEKQVTKDFLFALLFQDSSKFIWGKSVFASEKEANRELINRK